MARNIPPGTPDRSLRYIFPRGGRRSLRLAAIGGAAIAIALAALYLVGFKRVSSPGPVASSHSPIEARCEQCHDVGKSATDVRCERCHDPGGADRFTHAGHVLFGSGDPHQAGAPPPAQTPAELGRITLSGMKHKDPWVLYNAQRLRRMIDPAGINAEGAALQAQIAYLTQQTAGQPLSKVAVADLQTWQATLEQDLKSIDARLASKTPSGGDDAALNEMRNAVAQIAKQLAAVDPQASSLSADAQNTKGAGYAIAVDKSASQDFAARKNELIAVLD